MIGNMLMACGEAAEHSIVDNVDPFGDGSGIALYKLDGDATDESGNHDGVVSGAGIENFTGVGRFNEGVTVFNESNTGYISVSEILDTKSSFSYAAWVNGDTGDNGNYTYVCNSITSSISIHIRYNNNGIPNTLFVSLNNTDLTAIALNDIDSSDMVFMVLTWDKTMNSGYPLLYFYNYTKDTLEIKNTIDCSVYNGLRNAYSTSDLSKGIDCIVGTNSTYTDRRRVVIDQVRIFNRALTATEVSNLYTETIGGLPLPTTVGLVAWYPLTGTAEDNTGNYNGTENGGLTYVDDAERGSVASFDGVDDYVVAGFHSSIMGSHTFSISIWFKTDGDGKNYTLVNMSDNLAPSTEFALGVRTDKVGDSVGFFNRDNSGNHTIVVENSNTGGLNDGLWHHVAFVASPTGTNLYVDDLLASPTYRIGTSSTQATIHSNINMSSLGAIEDNGGVATFLNGKLSNLRIYNRALTQQEITDIYNYEKINHPIVVDDGLVAYYPLKTNSMDNYYQQLDGTDNGGVTYDGTSASFDGVDDSIVSSGFSIDNAVSFSFFVAYTHSSFIVYL